MHFARLEYEGERKRLLEPIRTLTQAKEEIYSGTLNLLMDSETNLKLFEPGATRKFEIGHSKASGNIRTNDLSNFKAPQPQESIEVL